MFSYTPLIALPAPSLAGIPFARKLAILKAAGYDGIEVFLFPKHAARLKEYRELAHRNAMRLSLHQSWSEEESAGIFPNPLLSRIGYLPENGYELSSLLVHANTELCVCYADYFLEVFSLRESTNIDFAFQTAATWSGLGEKRTHRMSYREFLTLIMTSGVPVVFDTFHVLEWRLGVSGSNLLRFSEEELARELLAAWHEIGPMRIIEIHWNDIGHRRRFGDGRGCLPGEGHLDLGLRLLAREIKQEGWGGYIIPELSPFLTFPYRKEFLSAVRERVTLMFA